MAPAPTCQLGKDGPTVPKMGFGLMGLSIGRSEANLPDEERFALLDQAHELGNTFWDTSDFYGDNEDLLSKWFARTGKRSDIFLATKFGVVQKAGGDIEKSSAGWGFRGDAEYVSIACEASLKRMGCDYIDLYYPHRLDGSTPVEDIVGEMVKLKEAGKIRHLGLVEVSAATLRRAHAVHPITAVQVEYSAFSTDIERGEVGLLAACGELGVAVVAYSPLSRGLLTGRVRSPADLGPGDVRAIFPRFRPENFGRNLALADRIRGLAEARGCTPGQLALAWLMAQDAATVVPIPGTIKARYLEENWEAAQIELSPEEVSEIRRFVDSAAVSGERYPEHMSLGLFADTPLP